MTKKILITGAAGQLGTALQRKLRDKFDIFTEFESKYAFYDLGFNLRPTEITGFLGLAQLKYLPNNIKKNSRYNILRIGYNFMFNFFINFIFIKIVIK